MNPRTVYSSPIDNRASVTSVLGEYWKPVPTSYTKSTLPTLNGRVHVAMPLNLVKSVSKPARSGSLRHAPPIHGTPKFTPRSA
ncbi:hypothetical protein D3C86_1523300 [compost metagenome]